MTTKTSSFEEWSIRRSFELGKELTSEAIKKGYIKEGQRVVCKFNVGKRATAQRTETLFPAELSESDKEEILSLGWKSTARSIICSLFEKNPKADKYPPRLEEEWLWSLTYQAIINNIFRKANLPWRVMQTGRWNDSLVYLATIIQKDNSPIGTVRFNPSLK